MSELVEKNGIFYCPECNSKEITAVIHKEIDCNSRKIINPSGEGIECWKYKCRKCDWNSELFVE